MLGLMAGCLAVCGISMAMAYMAHKKAWETGVELECLRDAVEGRFEELEKAKAAKRKPAKGGKKC